MTRNLWGVSLWIWGLVWMGLPALAEAQGTSFQNETFNFEEQLLSGFSEDGRLKVLMLTLDPSGMTETAATEFGKSIERNLFNTNHFTVVGPAEWNAQIQSRDPTLADCHDIACGILIGKLFNADKVLVGRISAQNVMDHTGELIPGSVLSVRLLDVTTNSTDFADEIQFTDETMQDELFRMAVRISENALLRGRVLNVKKEGVTLNLGRAHGLKVGDQLVIYTQPTTTDLEGKTVGLGQKNVAIAQITRLNDMSSDAILMFRLQAPETGHLVQTYVNHAKQIRLIADTRRELDTQKRMTPPPKPVVLKPQLVEEETGKEKWKASLNEAESEQRRWMLITGGAGATTLLLASGKLQVLGKNLKNVLPIATGAVTVYSAIQYFQARRKVNEIQAEGRVKGFMSWDLQIAPQTWNVALHYQF